MLEVFTLAWIVFGLKLEHALQDGFHVVRFLWDGWC